MFNRAFGPVDEGLVLLFVGNATKPRSLLVGFDEHHIRLAARSEAGGDVQFHMFTEFVFLPCRLEAVNRNGHVALVHAPTAASIAYVDLCFH